MNVHGDGKEFDEAFQKDLYTEQVISLRWCFQWVNKCEAINSS